MIKQKTSEHFVTWLCSCYVMHGLGTKPYRLGFLHCLGQKWIGKIWVSLYMKIMEMVGECLSIEKLHYIQSKQKSHGLHCRRS